MNELHEQFLIETRELVEQATDNLLALEQAPNDDGPLDGAFRAFHTLKGAAGIVEFAAMGRVMHAAEELLAVARAGDHPITADLIGDCLSCLDQIVIWVAAMESEGIPPGDAETAADALVARFASSAERAIAPVAPTAALPPPWVEQLLAKTMGAGTARTAIRFMPDAECFFDGDDPVATISQLPGLLAFDLHPREPWPELDDIDPFACNLIIDALSGRSSEEIAEFLQPVRGRTQIHALAERSSDGVAFPERAVAILKAQMALVTEAKDETFPGRLGSAGRVAANVLRHLGHDIAAATIDAVLAESVETADASRYVAALDAILSPQAAPETALAAVPSPRQKATARTLRIDVERVDAIVNLTGELTVVKNALAHASRLARDGTDPSGLAETLKDQYGRLDRLMTELHRSVLAIRVLPMHDTFRRFPRLVREMAGDLGKAVRLVTEGEATEADKAVVEGLFEPLLHVLRNAIDHGIESAEERAAVGKHKTATICLRCRREGEQVVVEVADDGRGVDVAAVRREAAGRGLATADALAAMPDDEVVDLIFTPGFSTRTSVTGTSGRGVGMDAVRAAIERIGGRITLGGRPGEGMTVRFTLPLSVMITRVMTVEAGGQAFGVPFEAVIGTLQLRRDMIAPIGAAEAFTLRDRTVPLVNLARCLGLEGDAEKPPVANIIVAEAGGARVDRFGEPLDVMLKPLEGLLARNSGRCRHHRAGKWPRVDRSRSSGIAAMTVEQTGDHSISLSDSCGIDDAGPVCSRLLLADRRAIVDWRSCEELHAAVIQILLAARPDLAGPPASVFLQNRIAPLVASDVSSIAGHKTG